MLSIIQRALPFFAIIFALETPLAGAADPVVAVLSSDASPYQEALAGLQETCGQPIAVVRLSQGDFTAPPHGSIVVAFGGKAALQTSSSYKGTVIYGLAPGIKIHSEEHSGDLVKVHTSPSVPLVIQKFKEFQPALRHLAVLWIGDSIADYVSQKRDIESSLGVELISIRMKTLEALPHELRNLQGKADAIWMPPDAALITPQSFAAVREFCYSQRIPFYVPSDGLVEKGAPAAVYTSFRELGKLAGSIAKRALEGHLEKTTSVFPENISFAINASASARCNLKIAPEVVRKAEKVIP